MITNERQYRITRSWASRFQQALATFDDDSRDGVHPSIVKAERDALMSQIEDLRAEIDEYERLKSATGSVISVASFDGLAEGLIKARIAAHLSQKELAKSLGLKEQQIQRYEAERYRSASYRRLQEVATALGVRIRNEILMPLAPKNLHELLKKLSQVGINRDFFLSRLLSSPDASRVLGEAPTEAEDDEALFVRIGEIQNRIFGWTADNLFGSQPLTPPRTAAAEARFKLPARRVQSATTIYSAYANYLAVVVLSGSHNLPRESIPSDARKMRNDVLERYGDLSLITTLRYAWDLGVPILPLRDQGSFHGACWRYEGRNVIVLKQASKYEARWIFDLFHEMFHAGQQPEAETMEVIEADVTSIGQRGSEQEIAASQFAGDVMLDGRAEELAQACVQAARNSVERLKSVVPNVAKHEQVGVGALANYMAFRLSLQNINWWGAAANLQQQDTDPWTTARDVFVERFPFVFEDELDQHLLNRALSAEVPHD